MPTAVKPTIIGTRSSPGLGGATSLISLLESKRKQKAEEARKKAISDELSAILETGTPQSGGTRPIVDAQAAAARAAAVGATPSEARTISTIVKETNAPARAMATERVLTGAGFTIPQGFHTADTETRSRLVAEQFEIRKTGRTLKEQQRESDTLLKGLAIADPEVARKLRDRGFAKVSPGIIGRATAQVTDVRRATALVKAEELKRRKSESDAQLLLRSSRIFSDDEVKENQGIGLAAAKALVVDRRAKVKAIGSLSTFNQQVGSVMSQFGWADSQKYTSEQVSNNRHRAVNLVSGRKEAAPFFRAKFGKQLASGEFTLPEDDQRAAKFTFAMERADELMIEGRTDWLSVFSQVEGEVNDFFENARMVTADRWKTMPLRSEMGKLGFMKHPETRKLIEQFVLALKMSRGAAKDYVERLYSEGLADQRIRTARGK